MSNRAIWECAAEMARVARGRARRQGNPRRTQRLDDHAYELRGALGGVAATPVINHPEVAIIGPNRIVERPVVRQGAIVVRKMMNLSSSFDHRIVDGYDAAEFVQRLKGAARACRRRCSSTRDGRVALLGATTELVQQRLGVAVRLTQSFEDQRVRRLERQAGFRIG